MKHKLIGSLVSGFDAMEAAASIVEESKDALRGGNSGCFVEEGRIAGSDPRVGILRYFGIQEKTDYRKQLMFDAGLTNEDSIVGQLKAAGCAVRMEEEVPVKWKAGHMDVTGRPDVMVGEVMDDKFAAEYGIELKLFCSVWSVMKHANFIRESKPKTDHIIQAAHYSWQNSYLPWVVLYANRVNWSIPFYAQKKTKRMPDGYFTDRDSPALRKSDDDVPYTFLPFVCGYDLSWDGDQLLVEGKHSAVRGEGIRQYYEYLASCIKDREVPEIQSLYDFNGDRIPEDKNDNIRYYKFKEARENLGLDTWLEDCKEITKDL